MKNGFLKKIGLLLSLVMVIASMTGCSADKYDKQFEKPAKGDTIAIIKTSYGDITVRFFKDEAPKAVENFITLAEEGYYDGVTFHRVVEDFMVQAGDPTGTGRGGESCWGGKFENEIVDYLSPYYGALCMANTGEANTNGSQFFIVTSQEKNVSRAETCNGMVPKDQRISEKKLKHYKEHGGAIWLDEQVSTLYKACDLGSTISAHTVFGQVIDGIEVAEEIGRVETYTELEQTDASIDDPGQTDIVLYRPKEPVIIETIEITTY